MKTKLCPILQVLLQWIKNYFSKNQNSHNFGVYFETEEEIFFRHNL